MVSSVGTGIHVKLSRVMGEIVCKGLGVVRQRRCGMIN